MAQPPLDIARPNGLAVGPQNATMADAIRNWLLFGLNGRSEATVTKCEILCNGHIIPDLGKRKLRELSATDVDRWLLAKAKTLSSATIATLHNYLRRAVTHAMARDMVKRNVVVLCGTPKGQAGRPSKSLTMAEAPPCYALRMARRSTRTLLSRC